MTGPTWQSPTNAPLRAAAPQRPDSANASATGQAAGGGKRPRRRVLSLLGATLTVLTALGVALLSWGARVPAERVPPVSPAGVVDGIAPAAGTGEPGAAPAPKPLAARGWRDLAALVERLPSAPRGIRLDGLTLVLPELDAKGDLTLQVERLTIEPAAAGQHLRATLAELDVAALSDRFGLGLVVWTGPGLRATLEARFQGGAPVGPWEVRLDADGPGSVQAFAMPEALPFERWSASLEVAPDWQSVRLVELVLTSPVLQLEATGEAAAGAPMPTVRGEVRLQAVDAPRLWALWPPGLADGARRWLSANLTAGLVDELVLHLDVTPDRLGPDGLDPGLLSGTARVREVEVHYLRPMAPVTGAAAEVSFDLARMDFDFTAGGIDDVEVLGGRLTISGYDRAGATPELVLDLRGRGPVATILRTVASEPIELAERRGLGPEGSRGAGDFRLELALPLIRDLPLEAVDFRFSGDFTGVRLPDAAAGREIDQADLRLEATMDRVEVGGRGRLDGVPLRLGFLADATAGIQRLTAEGTVDAALLERLGLPQGLPLSGPVGVEAVVDLEGPEAARVERTRLGLDLTAAEVLLADAALWKPEGVAGRVDAVIRRSERGTRIDDLALAWTGADVRGSAELDAGGALRRLQLDPLVLGGTDARLEAEQAGGRLNLRLDGRRLDLRPLRAWSAAPSPTAEDAGRGAFSGDVTVAVDELVWRDEAPLAFVTLQARLTDGLVTDAHARGSVDDEATAFRLDLEPRDAGGAQALRIEAADAGAVLRALGVSDDIRGGTLIVNGAVRDQRPQLEASGELSLDDFVLVNAPAAIRLLSQTPAQQRISPEAVGVSRSLAAFSMAGGVLQLKEASAIGSELAVNASGSIDLLHDNLDLRGSLAPVATVNRLLGNLPVIGWLLRGETGAGAFVITFAISGPRDDPRVVVNPLSIITPGVIRDLFTGTRIVPSEEWYSDRERD
ncbi:MAG: hypothetical protein EA356_10780 [Geminicoccaceae bacterium]|nr:MAG: hypothetical protein EA356_10780 [Geminicoccaceae bacterium]